MNAPHPYFDLPEALTASLEDDHSDHEVTGYVRLAERLKEISDDLEEKQVVGAATARSLSTLGSSLESVHQHFQHYPVATYTQVPSRVNLNVTQEGILGAIKEAVVKAAKAIWKFITGIFKMVGDFYSTNKRTGKVAQKAAANVATLAVTNQKAEALITQSPDVSPEQKAEYAKELEAILSDMDRSFSNKWNGLIRDLLDDSSTEVMDLFKVLTEQLHADSLQFMHGVSTFNSAAKDALKRGTNHADIASRLMGLNVDFVKVAPFVQAKVDDLLKGSVVRRAEGVTEYQAAYLTILSHLKTRVADRSTRTLEMVQILDGVEVIRKILDQGYYTSFGNAGDALLRVHTHLNEAQDVSYKLMDVGVDMAEILKIFQSMADGVGAINLCLRQIHIQISVLTNLVSQCEQRRLNVFTKIINNPNTPQEVRKELMALRDELKSRLT